MQVNVIIILIATITSLETVDELSTYSNFKLNIQPPKPKTVNTRPVYVVLRAGPTESISGLVTRLQR